MGVKLLKELNDFSYDPEEVKQSIEKGKPLVISGILQKADVLNQNGRIYPRDVLEPQVEAYKKLVRERRAVGELDHADEAVVNLKNASHVITDIWMDNNGDVKGKVEVLDKLPMGKILKNLIESNIKIGISSRALGSLSEEEDGDIVGDDLHFICWDMVSEPSTPGAWMIKEAKEYSRDELKKILSKQARIDIAAAEILAFQKKIKRGK
jgi:hypothetical protein